MENTQNLTQLIDEYNKTLSTLKIADLVSFKSTIDIIDDNQTESNIYFISYRK